MARRRMPAKLDRVQLYRVRDGFGARILTVTFDAPERGFEACAHAAHVLAITPGAVRVELMNTRERSRSFNIQTLAAYIEKDQQRGQDTVAWLRELGLLVGWPDHPKKLAKVKP